MNFNFTITLNWTAGNIINPNINKLKSVISVSPQYSYNYNKETGQERKKKEDKEFHFPIHYGAFQVFMLEIIHLSIN